jgi:hypothetical protein
MFGPQASPVVNAHMTWHIEPAAQLRDVCVEEARQLDGLLGRLADEAGCSGHSVA